MQIIGSMNDLRDFVDGSNIDTVSDWSAVVDRVANDLAGYDDCPDFGEDWSDFLSSFDFCELAIAADDALMAKEGYVHSS